ncbi:10130_t:CDS:2 [Entrophospora sp. SA101]|nr:10130_t:CDS:2 [Entrophospora sp. SA101]
MFAKKNNSNFKVIFNYHHFKQQRNHHNHHQYYQYNKSNLDPTIPVGQSDQSTNISTPVFTDGQAPTGVEFPDSYKDDQHKNSDGGGNSEKKKVKGKKKGDVGKNDDDSNLIYSEPNLQSTG